MRAKNKAPHLQGLSYLSSEDINSNGLYLHTNDLFKALIFDEFRDYFECYTVLHLQINIKIVTA